MAHLLGVLRSACNCRQTRTLPLYKGVFHRYFFSDTPIHSSHPSSETTTPVKRRVSRKKIDGVATVKRIRPKRISPTQLTEEDKAELSVSKLKLPPIDKWRQYFAIADGQRLRTFLRHPDTARMLAEAFVPEGSKDLIIIEAAPGPGQLTRALLNLPKERIKKLILLETPEKLLGFLRPLEEVDPRVRVFPLAPKDWNSYTQLFQTGLLDELQVVDWEQVHPQLRFIMQASGSVEGEQLLSQLLRAIPDRQWLFKYGRIPMSFIITSRMLERLRGQASAPARCKVSVMAQAIAELSEAVPHDSLQPFQDHFHPVVPKHEEDNSKRGLLDSRRTGNPMSAITAIPLQHQTIETRDLDFWDYCLRKLFVQKATALEKCINLLGPGAKNILPKLTDKNLPAEERVDIKKTPRSLDIREWGLVVRAFKEWPFRPEDLTIDHFFASHINRS